MDQGTRGELISRLAEAIRSVTTAHPLRVAIDGPPAAGKTTLADELAVVLLAQDRDIIRATIDDFLFPRAQRYRRGQYSAEGCYFDAHDYAALCRVLLDPLGPGGDRRFQHTVYDRDTDHPIVPAGHDRPRGRRTALRRRLPPAPRTHRPMGPAHLRVRPIRADGRSRPGPRHSAGRIHRRHRRNRTVLAQPLYPLPTALLRHSPPNRPRRHHRVQRSAPTADLGSPTTLIDTQDLTTARGRERGRSRVAWSCAWTTAVVTRLGRKPLGAVLRVVRSG